MPQSCSSFPRLFHCDAAFGRAQMHAGTRYAASYDAGGRLDIRIVWGLFSVKPRTHGSQSPQTEGNLASRARAVARGNARRNAGTRLHTAGRTRSSPRKIGPAARQTTGTPEFRDTKTDAQVKELLKTGEVR